MPPSPCPPPRTPRCRTPLVVKDHHDAVLPRASLSFPFLLSPRRPTLAPHDARRGADLVAVDSPPLELPVTSRRCPQLRRDFLFLPAKPIEPGRPQSPPRSTSSPRPAEPAGHHSVAGRPPPASLNTALHRW